MWNNYNLCPQTPPNPRPRQKTFNSNRQHINRRHRYNDPDYGPNKEHDLDNYMWFGADDADCSDQERYDQGEIE
ncbi:hypothetical protein F8M41_014844 [Gigaspora margarita]|uniref:Uncharacterized protein n=1 Tax=Gigaspora margarita TaxID=4874 RepID=A0A8H4A0I3_GIGMA|nr:hypothetical protein F8M41_014844 [Gigaspora margarita]